MPQILVLVQSCLGAFLLVVEINCNRHIELDLNPSANSKLFSFIVYCPISNHVTIPLRIVSHVVNQKRLEHL